MRKSQESFPSFFPPPRLRGELNSVILGGEATPALSTGSWNKWFVSDLQILKKNQLPFNSKGFMKSKMLFIPDMFLLFVTYLCRVMQNLILSTPADNSQAICVPQVQFPIAMGHKAPCLWWVLAWSLHSVLSV